MRATTLTVSSSRSRECVQVGNPFAWAHAARILPLECNMMVIERFASKPIHSMIYIHFTINSKILDKKNA